MSKPWSYQVKIFGFEVLGLYANIECENAKTIFGVRLIDNFLIGLCQNDRFYFFELSVMAWPRFASTKEEE